MKVHLVSLVNLQDTHYYILNDEGLKELDSLAVDYCEGIDEIAAKNILAQPSTIKEIVELLTKNNWIIEEEFSAILY